MVMRHHVHRAGRPFVCFDMVQDTGKAQGFSMVYHAPDHKKTHGGR